MSLSRKTSDLAVLPAAGILATHYMRIYMPEQIDPVDRDQRISVDDLEEYLLSADGNLSLVAGLALGPDPVAGSFYSSASHVGFAGIQNSGYPTVNGYVEDLSTGASGSYYLDYAYFNVNIQDGGVIGNSIQQSYNTQAGVATLSLYDPFVTIQQQYGVGVAPYVNTDISDSVTQYHVSLTPSSWVVYGDQNNFSLVNSDASDYFSYPFAGSMVKDGFITVINGVYNYGIGAGSYIASMEYYDSDTGDDILLSLDLGGIQMMVSNGGSVSMTAGAVNMIAAVGGSESKLLVDSTGIICITHNSNTFLVDELTGNVTLYKAHNNAKAFGNASAPELRSGSDTSAPTVTGTVNITSVSSPTNHKFSRVGNEVVGSFRVTIDPAAANTASQLRFTLPITSNIATADDVSGVAFSGSINTGGEVTGDAVNNAGYLDFISDGVAAAKAWTIFYQYTVKN